MKTVKHFLLVLLILISLTAIFNTPGANLLSSFYNLTTQTDKKDVVSWSKVFLQYPPGVYLTLNYFLSQFKVDPNIGLFDKQSVWLAVKFLLYGFYLFTFFSLLYMKKSNVKVIKLSFLDISIAYFASISILLASVGLIFFDILSAPFLILSITFLIQRRLFPTVFFYLVALFFNWNIFILGPIFLFIFLKDRISFVNKTVILGSFLVIPSLIILALFVSKQNSPYSFGNHTFLNPASFSKLLVLPFDYVFKIGRMDSLGWSVTILSLIVTIFGLGNLVKNTILKNIQIKKINFFLPYLIIPITFALSLFLTSSMSYSLLVLFLIVYVCFLIRFKSLPINAQSIIEGIFRFYLISSLFLQDLHIGSLMITVLTSLVMYIFNPSKFNFYLLLLLNLLSFINIFSNVGTTGILPIRGEYFTLFQTVFSSFFVLFIIWYLSLSFKPEPNDQKGTNNTLKWLIVILMLLLNFSWIPVHGSPDHISWTQYTIATIQEPNPFAAQSLVDQRYPPLSTAILGVFANSWKFLIGVSENYTIATKLSVIIFYFLTVILLIKFSNDFAEKEKLSTRDKTLVILTTFSLIIQTQGFADLNIHLIPSLFASIYFLFKRKYFLAGILMGITISIKWQPMILLPLFGATIVNINDFWGSCKKSLIFALGIFPIPILVWILVLINPGGKEAFERATEYLIHGAPMLSGQALNLNWIATYIIHIVDPVKFESLSQLDYLNRQIATEDSPWILQGYLFLIMWVVIAVLYWLKKKKNITNFLAASVMIFFSHYQLNKSAYEKHIFYVVIFMLFYYLIRPTALNRWLLILFDVMTVMNLILFYGFTGTESVNRRFFNFDITILFSVFYLIVFLWVLWKYLESAFFEK